MPDGDYIVCKCNHVSYYDIIDEVHKHSNMEDLLKVFEDVRDTTRCSTGCGGCYDKVMDIISRTIMGQKDKGTVLCPDYHNIPQLPSTREGMVVE